MTALLITVDTELSFLLHQRGVNLEDNIRLSIDGEVGGQNYGIGWQMDQLERYGLKGVFFVDPMPALVHGPEFLKPIVAQIEGRGHEVQLHLHSEWLASATVSPVQGRRAHNIGDFSLDDQLVLLSTARRLLEQAGASPITAFRAGNFGANDDTLRALAQLGVAWDSSLNPAYLGRGCGIGTEDGALGPEYRLGVWELPISGIADWPGGFRPAQVCAMSATEMRDGLRHAVRHGHGAFVVVTHSFEMLSRDRRRPNRAVMRRFTELCREAAGLSGAKTAGFRDLPPKLVRQPDRLLTRAEPNRMRTASRMTGQLWATWCYERRLIPA
jgi:peptidoglycan/xylan/chitin deacetylase (PgdA/CDA1 family)